MSIQQIKAIAHKICPDIKVHKGSPVIISLEEDNEMHELSIDQAVIDAHNWGRVADICKDLCKMADVEPYNEIQ